MAEEEETRTKTVVEIIPKNPSPEIHNDEPPKFSLNGVFTIIRKKGLMEAMSDDAWGPHVHLVMILIVITLIAIGVAIVT